MSDSNAGSDDSNRLRKRVEKLLGDAPDEVKGISSDRIHNTIRQLHERLVELESENERLQGLQAKSARCQNRHTETLLNQTGFFQKAVEFFPHPICLIDINDYSVKMTNSIPRGEELPEDTTCYALNHNLDEPCSVRGIVCPLEEAKKTRKPAIARHTHFDPDGNPRILEVSADPVFDDNGNVTHILEFALDITERTRAEGALRETNQLLETLIDSTHALIAYLDPQFNFIRVNKVYAEADEREKSFFPGKNHFRLYPNEENERIFQRVRESGEPYYAYAKPFEYDEHPERGTSYRDWSLIPIRGPKSDVRGLLLTITNVTEIKQAEAELQRKTHELGERIKELDCLHNVSNMIANPGSTLQEVLQTSVDLIPSSWQYPDITCARLVLEDKEFTSSGFQTSRWRQSADILVSGNPVGNLEVYCLKEMPAKFEGPFVREERELIDELARMIGGYVERKRAEQALQEAHDKLEKRVEERTAELAAINEQLRMEQEALERKNVALREVLDQIDAEKSSLKRQIAINIEQSILPMLRRLKEMTHSSTRKNVEMLEKDLLKIASPLIDVLKSRMAKLTPREIEICRLVKNGFTSKEIAAALNSSVQTVLKQRKLIRKKLGISNKNINLAAHLESLEMKPPSRRR